MNTPLLSIIAPAHNEQDNVAALVEQVGRAGPSASAVLRGAGRTPDDPEPTSPARAPTDFEFILVDDGSTDRTRAIALDLARDRPWLRIVAMTRTPPGRGNGQSAAFHAGFRAARGAYIAVLDADLQNDPADLAEMARVMVAQRADMVQGDRSHARQDTFVRRAGSVVGRAFRRGLLGDTIRDTGCSLRIMRREVALRLPLEFKGVHRFIPVSARHMGYTVVECPVNHRPRVAGETKYGMGILQRALPGLRDLFAVRWMRARRRPVTSVECVAEDVTLHERASAPAELPMPFGAERKS